MEISTLGRLQDWCDGDRRRDAGRCFAADGQGTAAREWRVTGVADGDVANLLLLGGLGLEHLHGEELDEFVVGLAAGPLGLRGVGRDGRLVVVVGGGGRGGGLLLDDGIDRLFEEALELDELGAPLDGIDRRLGLKVARALGRHELEAVGQRGDGRLFELANELDLVTVLLVLELGGKRRHRASMFRNYNQVIK